MSDDFLSRYRSLDKIGEGAYGVVYRARDSQTGDVVALKRIRLEQAGDEGVPGTTIREVSLLKELQHPNVVRLMNTAYLNRRLYLVFEFLDNDLRRYLDHVGPGKLDLHTCKKLCYQMMAGIAFCHSRRVLHRDLKPQNLLVDKDGTLKLADFGLARAFGVPVRQFTHEVVTLWYRAPEVLLGARFYSTPVDIWSCGCILAEIVSGSVLFAGDSEIDQLFRIFSILGTPSEDTWAGVTQLEDWRSTFPDFHPQDLGRCVSRLDATGVDLLGKLLCYDPAKRLGAREALQHPWFDEVRDECETFIRNNGVSDAVEA